MKLPDRRKFLHLAAGAAALPAFSSVAQAQAWPSCPVRLVVGFPAGGGADAAARIVAQRLSEVWGQQVVIENKGGAGGNIAIERRGPCRAGRLHDFAGPPRTCNQSVPLFFTHI